MLPVLCTQTGDELLEFHPNADVDSAAKLFGIRLVFVMIIPKYQGKVLFIYNAWRKEWEVPAGIIENGESPHTAAVRELEEESGQRVASLKYAGMVLLRVSNRLEPGVVYTGEIDTLLPFALNDETSDMMLWDSQTVVTGQLDEISLWLIQRT